jgi:hypothetical protein
LHRWSHPEPPLCSVAISISSPGAASRYRAPAAKAPPGRGPARHRNGPAPWHRQQVPAPCSLLHRISTWLLAASGTLSLAARSKQRLARRYLYRAAEVRTGTGPVERARHRRLPVTLAARWNVLVTLRSVGTLASRAGPWPDPASGRRLLLVTNLTREAASLARMLPWPVSLPSARRCSGDAAEMQRRGSGDAAERQRRCSGDAAEMQRRCSGDAAEMQRRCSGDAAEMPVALMSR